MITHPNRLARLTSLAAVAALVCSPFLCTCSSADACTPGHTAGVDLSNWNEWAFGYDGRAVVQTFFAEDTIISAMTVWRSYGEYGSYNGIHLMLGATDSTGMPVTAQILFDGPVLKVVGGGVNPVEYRYEFNPPIVVPRRDTFAVYFISNPCGDTFNLYRLLTCTRVGHSGEHGVAGAPAGYAPFRSTARPRISASSSSSAIP
jgi:hypothetical protein